MLPARLAGSYRVSPQMRLAIAADKSTHPETANGSGGDSITDLSRNKNLLEVLIFLTHLTRGRKFPFGSLPSFPAGMLQLRSFAFANFGAATFKHTAAYLPLSKR